MADINTAVESDNKDDERKRIEKKYGQTWNTKELSKDFTVKQFMAPYIIATKKDTKEVGTLQFQHIPRFYFNWRTN